MKDLALQNAKDNFSNNFGIWTMIKAGWLLLWSPNPD
jgi:hypothetical protein